MSYDLQKGSFLKRISAFILDAILLLIVITGFAWLFSLILKVDDHINEFSAYQTKYEELFDVKWHAGEDERYKDYTEDEKKAYDQKIIESMDAFEKDKDAMNSYVMLLQLVLLTATFSILIGFLILEFIVPLILKNGQTVGKKVFSLGVMRTDGVKLSPVLLFIRTVLGKYTIETMVPVFILVMIMGSMIGLLGILLLFGMLILQIVLVCSTQYRSAIHDVLARTVVVDLSSQLIFQSKEEMIEFKQDIQLEKANAPEYSDVSDKTEIEDIKMSDIKWGLNRKKKKGDEELEQNSDNQTNDNTSNDDINN